MKYKKLRGIWILATFIILILLAGYSSNHPEISNTTIRFVEFLVITLSVALYRKYRPSRKNRNSGYMRIQNISPNSISKNSKDLSLYTNTNSFSTPVETYQELTGRVGEDRIEKELRKLGVGRRVIRNLIIGNNDKTTEIDIVLVSECGIFVIESKNFNGRIFGGLTNQYWTQTFPNQTSIQFYNPILQNKGHIKALKSLLEKFPDVELKSVVVFSDNSIFKKVPESSNELIILHESELYTVLEDSIDFHKKFKRGPSLTPDQIFRIWDHLNQYNIQSYRKQCNHINNVRQKNNKV